MDFLKFTLLAALSVSVAHAGIYKCIDINGAPEEKLDVPSKLIPHTSEPFLVPNALIRAAEYKQKPFLIYYAIDPDEPFMNYAVDFEVTKLLESCQSSSDVNFAIIRNSRYLSHNEFVICKDRTPTTVNLSSYPALDELLKTKRKIILEEDHTLEEKNPILEFPVSYENTVNQSFSRFPLAHPDFLHNFINLLISEKSLFPTEEYIPFLNLKSHGSREYVLSGLHPCQLQAKNKAQKKYIQDNLPIREKRALRNSDVESKYFGKALDSLLLGSKMGAGSNLERLNNFGLNNYGLNNYGLNNYGLGPVGGLSQGQGLEAQFAFGTYHVAVNAVLRSLFNEETGKIMGFVMFESCDTNRDPIFNHTVLENTLGFYSAKHSLWYRNLNWWNLLDSANGSAEKLLNSLDQETRLIPNLEIVH
jgi:hypothetical protein